MLETNREYAAELLRRDGESERIREAHAPYFLNLAETAETWGVHAEDWLDRFGQDIDNLRTALAWFQERGSVQRFLRLATSLFLFWERRNHVQEGITWLEYGLTRAAEVPALLRAAALRWQGVLITRLGADFGRAQVLLKESLMLFLAAGTNDEAIAGAMQNLGLAYAEGGDHAQARPFLEESLARYRSLNDMRGTGKLLDNLGRLEWLDGNRRRARELLSEGVTLSRRAGDKWMMGMNGLALGIALTEEGEHDRARPLLREAFLALHCTGDRWAIALALHVLGKAALRQAEPLRAIRLFGASASALSAVKMAQFADAEHEIAVARSKTGAGDYEAGWNEGRSMSLDRIGAYALEGLRDGGGPMAPQPH